VSVDPWIVVAAVAAGLLVLRLSAGRRAPASSVAAKLAAGATVIDVRSPDEFRRGAWPGAVNIPLASLASRVAELPRDRPVVLYCASGARSGAAAGLLRRAGFADVVNAGGLRNMPPRRGAA
jgi:phage shock protein E